MEAKEHKKDVLLKKNRVKAKKNKILFRYSRNYGYFCQRYLTTTLRIVYQVNKQIKTIN